MFIDEKTYELGIGNYYDKELSLISLSYILHHKMLSGVVSLQIVEWNGITL